MTLPSTGIGTDTPLLGGVWIVFPLCQFLQLSEWLYQEKWNLEDSQLEENGNRRMKRGEEN